MPDKVTPLWETWREEANQKTCDAYAYPKAAEHEWATQQRRDADELEARMKQVRERVMGLPMLPAQTTKPRKVIFCIDRDAVLRILEEEGLCSSANPVE